MASPSPPRDSDGHQETMDFIETAQYNAPSASSPTVEPPYPWRRYQHPNGDVYFYHDSFRFISPDDVCDPLILEYLIDAREEYLQSLGRDPNFHPLPMDYELVISDVSEEAATIRMYSRSAGQAYEWTEERGLTVKGKEHFWSFVAEYPSHHQELPPHTEDEFVQALNNATQAITSGTVFPFSERQISQIVARYQSLRELRSRGRNVTASLAWLIGAVMPLDAVGTRVNDQGLDAVLNGHR
ncbi:hypothetical protein M413DRAFT_75683 [Hebeloma cylindrosporum]|uniref:WW domain-containing protein n=1 Tax=Hebeloma cylindrosporum TaxID=76867 RepID=A0A0C2XLX7_HEBCY|nr:hypothetical protein M413DRAFT_75683 [Hebeloma cylindrosporum h7]